MGVAGWVCSQGWGGLCSLGVWNGTVLKNKVQTTQWRSVWKLQGEVLCNVLKFYPVRSSNRLIRKGPVFLPFAPRKWPKNRMDVHRVCSVFGRLKCIWDLGLSMSFSSEEFDFGLIIFFWWMTRIWVSWVSAVLYTKGVNRPLESVSWVGGGSSVWPWELSPCASVLWPKQAGGLQRAALGLAAVLARVVCLPLLLCNPCVCHPEAGVKPPYSELMALSGVGPTVGMLRDPFPAHHPVLLPQNSLGPFSYLSPVPCLLT